MQQTRTYKSMLMAFALAVGVSGYSLSQSNILSFPQAQAAAVKVNAPAVFSFADVVEAVSPAVVSVRVESKIEPANFEGEPGFFQRHFKRWGDEGPRDYRRDRSHRPHKRGPSQSQGSGFFISEDGLIVTNNHVIEHGSKFTVVMSDGKEMEAELIGADPRTDLAVLKVEAEEKFTHVDFGGNRPRIGEWVVAVGNPFGLGGTVTAGIVSAHSREISTGRYNDFIQIDAAVNKGNSGGPAFNLQGEVIGVNTAIFSPSGGNVGIAFSIPAETAEEVVAELVEKGSVTRGWLGVYIQPVTKDIAESLDLKSQEGALVANVSEDSPAQKAGLQPGDVVTAIDGKTFKDAREFSRLVADRDPNSQVDLTLQRAGETEQATITLGELKQAEAKQKWGQDKHHGKHKRFKRLGIELEETENGVAITGVRPGSKAEERGLQEGDVIVSVNGENVNKIKNLGHAIKSAKRSGKKVALLQVERDGNSTFIPIPLKRGS